MSGFISIATGQGSTINLFGLAALNAAQKLDTKVSLRWLTRLKPTLDQRVNLASAERAFSFFVFIVLCAAVTGPTELGKVSGQPKGRGELTQGQDH